MPSTSKTSNTNASARSTRSVCRHGSYGPTCMCTVASDSLPEPQPAKEKQAANSSFGDVLRAKLGIKEHKLCRHGSYGPTCQCDTA